MTMLEEIRRWIPATRIVAIGEGDFCSALLVDDRVVVRVAKHDAATAALEREAALLPVLADHVRLPIPRPLFLGRTATGHGIMGHVRVDGVPLTRERMAGLAGRSRRTVLRDLLQFVEQLHTFDIGSARAVGIPIYRPREAFAYCRPEIDSRVLPRLSAQAGAQIGAALDRVAEGGRDEVLVHNDLSPAHILVDADGTRLSGIIDFGDAAISDPDFDLRFVYEDLGSDALTELLAGDPRGAERFARARAFSIADTVLWILERLDAGADAEVPGALAQLEAEVRGSWSFS